MTTDPAPTIRWVQAFRDSLVEAGLVTQPDDWDRKRGLRRRLQNTQAALRVARRDRDAAQAEAARLRHELAQAPQELEERRRGAARDARRIGALEAQEEALRTALDDARADAEKARAEERLRHVLQTEELNRRERAEANLRELVELHRQADDARAGAELELEAVRAELEEARAAAGGPLNAQGRDAHEELRRSLELEAELGRRQTEVADLKAMGRDALRVLQGIARAVPPT